MQEGYLFFTLMWLGCWYFVFISDENVQIRRSRVVRLLLGICFAGLSIPVFHMHINLFLIVSVVWAIYQWRNWTNIQLIKSTVTAISIMIALICIRIFVILYPVWFMINWMFIAAVTLVGISIMLVPPVNRVTCLTIGIVFGEVIYSIILYGTGFPIEFLGSHESLDLLLLTMSIAVLINKTQSIWAKRTPGRRVYPQHQMGIKGKGVR